MPPLMPAAKFRPVRPSTTTRPPVMYSQPWSPSPRRRPHAPEFRTAKRSPARPRKNAFPAVAPYSTVLPTITFSSATKAAPSGGRTASDAARQPLADVVVRVAVQRQLDAGREPGAEGLAGRAVQPKRIVPGGSPAAPCAFVTACESRPPTVRLTFRTG